MSSKSSFLPGSPLAFVAVIGMGGSFISLALSKWTAKRLTGAEVITSPGSEKEAYDRCPSLIKGLDTKAPSP